MKIHFIAACRVIYILGLAFIGATGCTSRSPRVSTIAPVSPTVTANPSTPASVSDLTTNPPSRSPQSSANLPTIFVAGDSTAARGKGDTQQGWAVPFADYFDPAKVNVVNRARGGRSSRTFIAEGLWDQLLTEVKPGDIVLIQFGMNDPGPINAVAPITSASRARGSIPGLGEKTEEIDNLLTKKHEVVHTYGWYMHKMIGDTQGRGATPIVLGVTIRNVWKDGKVERSYSRYSQWAADEAKAAGVPFIDVTDMVADQYEAMGQEAVKALYVQDSTHFNAVGAEIHASMVVAGLKGLRPSPVKLFLSAKGQAVKPDQVTGLNLPRPAHPALPTLYLIGDSTVRNGHADGAGGQWGWGDFLGPKFDTNKINVVNQAVGGLSSRTYLTMGHWDRVLAMLQPGDFVMMQFGHNDGGALNDSSRARASLRGAGEETQEIDNLLTKRHETVHTYGWYLRKFVNDAKAKGVTPFVCSLIPRKTWKDDKIVRNKDTYAGWAEAVAKAEGVGFIDLNEIIASRYDELGQAKVEPLFAVNGGPHTSAEGAELNAQCVVAGLQTLSDDPLAPYLLPPNR